MTNPYVSSVVLRDAANSEFHNGEFRIEGRTIVGGDRIELPAVCVFTGETEKLASRSSLLWRFSLLAWLPFLGACAVLVIHIFSNGWRNGPGQTAPLLSDSLPTQVLSRLNTRVAATLIVAAIIVGFFLQRKTRIIWFLQESEARVRRLYSIAVLAAMLGMVIVGYFYRPVAGWIAFVVLFHLFYSNRRFPRLKLMERRKGFSRIGGLSAKFLQAAEPSAKP